jgi:dTDP-3-amino-3,4,6-trideoxy-alpha-D-glucose transaminase
MAVPFLDLTRQNREIFDAAVAIFTDAMHQSAFIGGKRVEEFEQNFARFCGAKFGISIKSGTDALRLAIAACGLGPGDEVITSPFTFIATAEVITQNGGRVVFSDIDPDTFNLDPRLLERRITPRTRGILPVHLYGNPAAMGPIQEIARRHNLWVLEDACQSHGATLNGKVVGSLGSCAAFSFYPTKNMGAFGEGGFVTTKRIQALRSHGQSVRYVHDFEGFNARLDAIQAGILNEKLKRLPAWNEERIRLAGVYQDGLAGVGDLVLPRPADGATHVYHLFTVRSQRRDALQSYLSQQGIGTAIHYPIPLHMQAAYQYLGHTPEDFPVSLACSRTVLSLPLYQGITEDEIAEVIAAVRKFFS